MTRGMRIEIDLLDLLPFDQLVNRKDQRNRK